MSALWHQRKLSLLLGDIGDLAKAMVAKSMASKRTLGKIFISVIIYNS